jgi:hypothetical protein
VDIKKEKKKLGLTDDDKPKNSDLILAHITKDKLKEEKKKLEVRNKKHGECVESRKME